MTKFKNYLKESAFNDAFFISPKGEIIYAPSTHIQSIIQNPKKFGLDKYAIEYIYKFYHERMGQEGKAREQLLTYLFKEGWIRLRRYRNFWSVNVKALTGKVKKYLEDWAKKLLSDKLSVVEDDPYIDIKIDQASGKVVTKTMKDLANVNESTEYEVKEVDIEDMEDLPLYDFVNEFIKRNKLNV